MMNDDRFKVFLVVLVIGFLFVMAAKVEGAELNGIPEDAQRIKFTCYCPESCPGTVTASGAKVREGIIAASEAHMGDGAMIYLMDGTFLGYYECLDTGGSAGIKNGRVIDVWAPNLEKAKHYMELTQGEVMIRWIEDPKG